MTASPIPGFHAPRARAHLQAPPQGMRRGEAIYALARHRLARTVDGLSIADPGWLAQQEALWPHLAPVMDRQRADGSWAPLERDRTGWFHTTPWALAFLGYVGLNGTVHPSLVQAAAFFCDHLALSAPGAYACRYALFLRGLLQLGFADPASAAPGLAAPLRRVCETHLTWILSREQHCRGATRKGATWCACALVKELLFLGDWPTAWQTAQWTQAVDPIRRALLDRIDRPAHCSAQGRMWSELGYFRHVCPSWFEVVEALTKAGAGGDPRLAPALSTLGERCLDGATWLCEYQARRSVKLEGKRRTISWWVNLEPMGQPSPWLSVCALEITRAAHCTGRPMNGENDAQ